MLVDVCSKKTECHRSPIACKGTYHTAILLRAITFLYVSICVISGAARIACPYSLVKTFVFVCLPRAWNCRITEREALPLFSNVDEHAQDEDAW